MIKGIECRRHRILGIVIFAFLSTCTCSKAQRNYGGQPLVLVGPNIRVTQDGDGPTEEVHLAGNPKNAKDLLGAGIVFGAMQRTCEVFNTSDGGYSWARRLLVDPCGDPQVAYGDDETAYFVDGSLCLRRSRDGGQSWLTPVCFGGSSNGIDHPQMVVDHTHGKYHSRVYVATGGIEGRSAVNVFYSLNGGETFSDPHRITGDEISDHPSNVQSLSVFADGTLLVPIFGVGLREVPLLCATSRDGGNTYSTVTKIGVQHHGDAGDESHSDEASYAWSAVGISLAADVSTGSYANHAYIVWEEHQTGQARLIFSRSADQGNTWSKPQRLIRDVAAAPDQYQPTIAVNNQGYVAVSWFNASREGKGSYDLYVAASIDGGLTFSSPRRVSSQRSFTFGAGNATVTAHNGGDKYEFLAPINFRPAGGDYMGLVADIDGIFHVLYTDSRSGKYEMWTSQIRITDSNRPNSQFPNSQKLTRAVLNEQVKLVFDQGKYDERTQEEILSVRIKNNSAATLYGPLSVEVLDIGVQNESGGGIQISNASNHKRGPGAFFDYTIAMRDFNDLAPGATTEAIEWRIKLPAPEKADFYIKTLVQGFKICGTPQEGKTC
jgi:hypothetical protein